MSLTVKSAVCFTSCIYLFRQSGAGRPAKCACVEHTDLYSAPVAVNGLSRDLFTLLKDTCTLRMQCHRYYAG